MPMTIDSKMRTKNETSCPTKLEKNEILRRKNHNDDLPDKLEEIQPIHHRSEGSSSPSLPPTLSPAYSLRQQSVEPSNGVNNNEMASSSSAEKTKKKVITNGTNTNKQKKKKSKGKGDDPNAPKRWRTAYVQFILKRRPSLAADKSLSLQEINRAVAAEWSKLNMEDRKPFEELARAEKEKYEEEMKKYMKTPEYAQHKKKLQSMNRKRKRAQDESDWEDNAPTTSKTFPPISTFCPLMNETVKKEEAETLEYTGKIFSTEFVTYNKARESYRRQLQMERSSLLHELDALHDHDLEMKIDYQEEEIKKLDKKLENVMKSMTSVLSGINVSEGNLSNIESLTDWMKSVSKSNNPVKKQVREAISKIKKS